MFPGTGRLHHGRAVGAHTGPVPLTWVGSSSKQCLPSPGAHGCLGHVLGMLHPSDDMEVGQGGPAPEQGNPVATGSTPASEPEERVCPQGRWGSLSFPGHVPRQGALRTPPPPVATRTSVSCEGLVGACKVTLGMRGVAWGTPLSSHLTALTLSCRLQMDRSVSFSWSHMVPTAPRSGPKWTLPQPPC